METEIYREPIMPDEKIRLGDFKPLIGLIGYAERNGIKRFIDIEQENYPAYLESSLGILLGYNLVIGELIAVASGIGLVKIIGG